MYQTALQISLSPNDLELAKKLLPHQLKVWHGQVEKVYLVCDTQKSRGRFGDNWVSNYNKMISLLEKTKDEYENIEVLFVDYSKITTIGNSFFGKKAPKKDFRGGPFFSYFYAISQIPSKYILHIDSDIFFGGQSQNWFKEAVTILNQNDQILYVSPLPGPPREDGLLLNQKYKPFFGAGDKAYAFNTMSTRIFLIDKIRLYKYLPLPLKKVKGRKLLKALADRNPYYDLPENLLTQHMVQNNLIRVDFLGKEKGMWTLHPPYKTGTFYENILSLINRIDKCDIPDSQKGFYDIHDSMIDWSDARKSLKKNRWWRKLFKKA